MQLRLRKVSERASEKARGLREMSELLESTERRGSERAKSTCVQARALARERVSGTGSNLRHLRTGEREREYGREEGRTRWL